MPLTTDSLFMPSLDAQKFISRRSVVHSTKGIVSCSQPLAAKCGIDILEAGGNCADAAVAVAAGLNMTEPCSTGIGGDVFCLFYSAKTGQVSAMNASGRSGNKFTLETMRKSLGLKDGEFGRIPILTVHSVIVPGAAAGWVDAVERFGSGKLNMEQILAPAIELGEKGFPVGELVGGFWPLVEAQFRAASPNFKEMLKADPDAPSGDGYRAPRGGEIMKNPNLAQTFRTLAKDGKKGFYSGRIAEAIVEVCKELGGHLELEDLQHHLEMGSEPVDPISLKFRGQGVKELLKGKVKKANGETGEPDYGVELWEHPPNGQGIVALIALGIIQELELAGKIPTFKPEDHNSAAYLHAIIEALRLAFADAHWWVTDPNVVNVPSEGLISKEYLAERAKLFDPEKASNTVEHGTPSPALQSSDTVYFACSDSEGNAISFINSNYSGFGTYIIPKGCGFTLQNRGSNFSLEANHPNVMAPRKRPYHTIIPAAVTNLHDGSLHSVYGVMGGFMQPQGHVQVLLNQIVGRMSPQQALDSPRICIGAGLPDAGNVFDWTVNVEEGIPEETIEGLKKLGHQVKLIQGAKRSMFGKGQVIRWSVDPVDGTGIWSAGSDPRGDGAAYPH